MTVSVDSSDGSYSHGADTISCTGLSPAAGDLIVAACVVASGVGDIAVPTGYTANQSDPTGNTLLGAFTDSQVQFVYKFATGSETDVTFTYDGGAITIAAVAAVFTTGDDIDDSPAWNDVDGVTGQAGNQSYSANQSHATKELGISWVLVNDSTVSGGLPGYSISGATDAVQVAVPDTYNRGRTLGLVFEEAADPRAFSIDVTAGGATWDLNYAASMWDIAPFVSGGGDEHSSPRRKRLKVRVRDLPYTVTTDQVKDFL